MPARPPVFRPPGWKPRKPWSRPVGQNDKRIRGRAGQRMRKQVLEEEPFCRECLKRGLQVRAVVVDHIIPLAFGGTEDRANKQSLCDPCHDEKSKREREEAQRGAMRI